MPAVTVLTIPNEGLDDANRCALYCAHHVALFRPRLQAHDALDYARVAEGFPVRFGDGEVAQQAEERVLHD